MGDLVPINVDDLLRDYIVNCKTVAELAGVPVWKIYEYRKGNHYLSAEDREAFAKVIADRLGIRLEWRGRG